MRDKWVRRIGWTFLVLFTLGSASDGKDTTAAIMFLSGVIIYWSQKINQSIQDLKQ